MIKKYKNIVLGVFFMTSLVYAEKTNKLKAEIKQKKNNLVIKISKNNEDVNEIETPKDNGMIYIIKQGDTLSYIALRYKKSIKKIAEDNNIKNLNLIITGNKIVIK